MTAKNAQTYKYVEAKSILGTAPDEYHLTVDEYYRLYSFYVTYSMCGTQSRKKRTFMDYGWASNKIAENGLKTALAAVLKLHRNPNFEFPSGNTLRTCFASHDLGDEPVSNFNSERAVIANTSRGNKYTKLFHHVRNGFAHGKFALRYSSAHEKMVVIQDDDSDNVTARIVIKLGTLLGFVAAIDLNHLI